jgi:uncharacterized protein YjdB
MTFKHKLSARLARLWLGLPLFALLSLASCDIRARNVTDPIPPGTIERVQLSPPVVTLTTNAMTDFVAVGMTADGDTVQSAVSWSVTGGALVQTADDGGRHIGRYKAGSQPGSYRVIAMAPVGSAQTSDTASVIVTTIPVASVVVSPAAVALDVGQSTQLAATPQDASGAALSGRAIAWTSGNTGVATVSPSGLVTAKGAGSTTVTAASEGQSGSASITVTQVPVASVDVTPASASIAPGGTVQLTAVAKDGAGAVLPGRPIAWSTSSAQIATVAGGLVTGVAAGTAQIVATSEGKSDTATITVAVIPVASVEVTPASANIAVGSTVQLTAVAKDGAGTILSGRPMTWSTSSAQIATVAAGLVTGVAAGTAYIVATSEGKSDTATITVTFTPVASVTVSPGAASVVVGGVVQLAAMLKDANGNTLTGRLVSWTSGNAAVATVTGTGLVTGVGAGSATITATSEAISGTSAITVIAPPPPDTGSCLTRTGPTIVVSGLQTTWGNTSMADNTKVDASTALFAGGANTPVRIGGGSGICYSGGVIIGRLPPSTAWSAMHDTYAMVVNGASALKIENVRIFDYGDGPTMDDGGDANWTFRGSYLKYMRDDCIENDFLNNGLIEDSFLDGCYDGVSSREYSGAQDGSNNVVVMRNSLVRLQAMDRAYSGTVPNHNAFWKWSSSIGPKVALYNNVFRADQPSKEGNGAGMYMAPPPGKLADCENNVMVWLGTGPFPETLPTTFNGKPCFRLLTGAEGLQYWNDAAARWKANHPWTLVDAAAPIASLFSPGIVGSTTLTGTVTLTATAVDDQDVAGVQFQLNGQNIGAEVTVESPLTKFTRSWDSRSLPNGTYTLTATARDTAGNTTTSAGVTVTISN